MVGTNGVLIVTVVWVDTLAMKRAVEAMERRADFITTVARKLGRTSNGRRVLPSWGKANNNDLARVLYGVINLSFIYAKQEK